MYIRPIQQIILICTLTTLPLNVVLAESLIDAVLRFTGISITTSQVRGLYSDGNLWLVKIDASGTNETKQITKEGDYHSPLWIPGTSNILAIKNEMLIQVEIEGDKENNLYSLTDTLLLGFDKRDHDLILIIQKSLPAVLSLTSGRIVALPYDEDNPEDKKALNSLMSSFRDYGQAKVSVEKLSRVDASGRFKKMNKIHIQGNEHDFVIACPAICEQPALNEDGQRLIFVD